MNPASSYRKKGFCGVFGSAGWKPLSSAVVLLIGTAMCSACSSRADFSFEPTIHLAYSEFEVRDDPMNTGDFFGLVGPNKVIVGPAGSILVADTGNDCILQIGLDGTLRRMIGRTGSGPGEFREPFDILYSAPDSVLWVFDSQLQTVSHFRLGARSAEFLSQSHVPGLGGSSTPKTARAGPADFWVADRWAEHRVKRITLDGETTLEFGELWEDPTGNLGGTAVSTSGRVFSLQGGRLLWLWDHRPKLEVWSAEGALLSTCELRNPETDFRVKQLPSPGEDGRYPIYHSAAYLDDTSQQLFLAIPGGNSFPWAIYQYSLDGCSPVVRYQIPANGTTIILWSFVVIGHDSDIQVIAVDRISEQLLKLEPSGND